MLSQTKSQRVLNRMGARILRPEETRRVSGGTTVILDTPIMTFIGTDDPDVKPDCFTD